MLMTIHPHATLERCRNRSACIPPTIAPLTPPTSARRMTWSQSQYIEGITCEPQHWNSNNHPGNCTNHHPCVASVNKATPVGTLDGTRNDASSPLTNDRCKRVSCKQRRNDG